MASYKAVINGYGFYIQPDEIEEYTEKGYTVYELNGADTKVIIRNAGERKTGSFKAN